MSTTFAKFHPSYLIGGTLSGQVGISLQRNVFLLLLLGDIMGYA